MIKKLNSIRDTSASFSKNTKGLSLVELLVAMVVLSLVVVPLFQAFVTSSRLTTKSRKLNEATDTAQNIQEVIDSVSADSLIAGTSVSTMASLLGISEDEIVLSENEETHFNELSISGITSGLGTYDAKVTFGEGLFDDVAQEGDGFYEINNKKIAKYGEPDGTFAQGFRTNTDPDQIADTNLYVDTNSSTYTKKTRTIYVDVEQQDGKIYVNITYSYEYRYNKTTDSIHTVKGYSTEVSYSVIPSGVYPHADGTPVTAYILYYPDYSNGLGSGDNGIGGNDVIKIYNYSDVPVRLFLVKQWPVEQVFEMEKGATKQYFRQAEIEAKQLEGWVVTGGYDYQTIDAVRLTAKEVNYHPWFEMSYSSTYLTEDVEKNELYTNAGFDLTNDNPIPNGQLTYRIFNQGSPFFSSAANRLSGEIVDRESGIRLYDVKIDIYESGSDDIFASYDGSKLR